MAIMQSRCHKYNNSWTLNHILMIKVKSRLQLACDLSLLPV